MTKQSAPERVGPSDPAAPATGTTFDGPPLCGARATCTLPRSLRAPAEARRFVEEQICARHNLATAAVALVASEVVTQAVLRGEGPVSIALECDVTTLTLSVSCWMGAPAEALCPGLGDQVSSMIVDGICSASGTEQTERGLTMWCTIPSLAGWGGVAR